MTDTENKWYVGLILDDGVVVSLVGFKSETEPLFTNNEEYPGIWFATEEQATRMALWLGYRNELGADIIVFQE